MWKEILIPYVIVRKNLAKMFKIMKINATEFYVFKMTSFSLLNYIVAGSFKGENLKIEVLLCYR